jgi:hypothetical protein
LSDAMDREEAMGLMPFVACQWLISGKRGRTERGAAKDSTPL